jgi:hypothetical protein
MDLKAKILFGSPPSCPFSYAQSRPDTFKIRASL